MSIIKKQGADKAPQVCLIFDDCIGNTQFMKNKWVVKSFIASRHFNATTMLCAQHWTRVERVNRLQASMLYFWPMSQSALDLLADEFTPSGMKKKQFIMMVQEALSEPYSFLGINMRVPDKDRYRINLDQIINIEHYKNI